MKKFISLTLFTFLILSLNACNNEQKVNTEGCTYVGESTELPKDFMTQMILKPEAYGGEKICINSYASRYSWTHEGINYTYTISELHNTNIGNLHYAREWELKISPPVKDTLQIDNYPFLECKKFYDPSTVSVRTEDENVIVSRSWTQIPGGDGTDGSPKEQSFQSILKEFEGCNEKKSWIYIAS